jgi:NAD-dependent SIR2 family protein deacetylase
MVRDLVELMHSGPVCMLTGAGCSTESGIPDYRGPGSKPRNPIQHRDFVEKEATRRRYWARSAIGWPRMAGAKPNAAHDAIASLERSGHLSGLITQNVDRLHHKAGSRDVLELHGALAEVRCLECNVCEARDHLQARMHELNPSLKDLDVETAPDGDAELSSSSSMGTSPPNPQESLNPLRFAPRFSIDEFRVPACLMCGGVLKPDVVFFGGSVPRDRVESAFAMLDRASALVVVGSSLAVFSGFRFVLRAKERGIPVAIVNQGETRGDPHAALRIDGRVGEVLPALARAVC